MTLARLTVWVDGQILTAGALNNEFDNILSNGVNLISPLTGALNFAGYPPSNFYLYPSNSVLVSTAGGLIYFYSSQNIVVVHDSTGGVHNLGPNSGLSRPRGLTGSLISNIGTFAAQDYQMFRANEGIFRLATTAAITINTQTAGPIVNGRDQAAAFASTDVHFYAITSGLNSTAAAGIASAVAPPTGPILPTSYNSWAYLGSAKYDVTASAVTQPWIVRGSRIHPQSSQGELLDIIYDTSERLKITTSAVPTIATNINLLLNYGVSASVGGINALSSFRIASESSPAGGYPIVWQGALLGVLNGSNYGAQSLTLPHTGTVAALTVMSTGLGGLGVMLNSYTVPNGDN